MAIEEHIDIQHAQGGDRAAFGRLVEGHRDLVFGICYRMTDQPTDAEDLAHEAFVEAFLKLRTLRCPDRFDSWLRSLTLNVCRMWHRRRKRVRLDALSDDLPIGEQESRDAQVAGCLAHLSEKHRMALALHYWEGLSYEEMSRFLDVPIGTVMSRMNRARQALKQMMEESEGLEMAGGRDLQAEVDVEIGVLLELFGEDVDSMERLSVILEKSPDRFRQVIAQVDDAATVEQVALLVRHLSRPAVEVALGCYFDSEGEVRTKAFAVLQRLIGRWEDRDKPDKTYK